MDSVNIQSHLSSTQSQFNIDNEQIEILFSIENNEESKIVFCSYFTPMEGLAADIFRIIDDEGNTLEYNGIMVKRGEPTEDDYITILQNGIVSSKINLKEGYNFTKIGRYSIQFIGSDIYGDIPMSNTLEIFLTQD